MDEPAAQESTGGSGLGHREVTLSRTGPGEFEVRNERGGTLRIGGADDASFRPVELLLAAIAGCSAVDVDAITGRRALPDLFEVHAAGEKVRDEQGNRMEGLTVTFTARYPAGPEGDKAREMLPRAIQMSHDRLCTVSRTVQVGAPIDMQQA